MTSLAVWGRFACDENLEVNGDERGTVADAGDLEESATDSEDAEGKLSGAMALLSPLRMAVVGEVAEAWSVSGWGAGFLRPIVREKGVAVLVVVVVLVLSPGRDMLGGRRHRMRVSTMWVWEGDKKERKDQAPADGEGVMVEVWKRGQGMPRVQQGKREAWMRDSERRRFVCACVCGWGHEWIGGDWTR